jgi:GNAT superfamily N-acetyltransferase
MVKIIEDKSDILIHNMTKEDIASIVDSFTFSWSNHEATLEKWNGYFQEQQKNIRTVFLLKKRNEICGYASFLRESDYPHFKNAHIPEIHDLWIASQHRKNGYGKMLVNHLEQFAFKEGYEQIGLRVGLYQDYGSAQRLYIQQGYVPDGIGITYENQPVIPGKSYPIDDELVLGLTKTL